MSPCETMSERNKPHIVMLDDSANVIYIFMTEWSTYWNITFYRMNLTALCARQKHNLPTYVAFVELVKAFDTVSHSMMLKMLEKYGAPPKLRYDI